MNRLYVSTVRLESTTTTRHILNKPGVGDEAVRGAQLYSPHAATVYSVAVVGLLIHAIPPLPPKWLQYVEVPELEEGMG